MEGTTAKKVCQVKKDGEKYIVSGEISSSLQPKFLAKNPEGNEIFFLLGNNRCYLLLKGDETEGLSTCDIHDTQEFLDCVAIMFRHKDSAGVFTDPDSFSQTKPVFHDMSGSGKLIKLDVLAFELVNG